MSPKAVKSRLETMNDLWLLSVKLKNSKKVKLNDQGGQNKCYETGELAGYLFNYCANLLTETEKAAFKHNLVLKKIESAESPMLREKWISSDEKVLELLKDGESEFFKRLEERVLRDNPQKEFMNLCPKCGYLTITPKAQQCRKCHHSWHEETEK